MPTESISGLSPITLGTVQLGLPYGLGAARAGIDAAGADKILDAAWAGGIRCFDTARAYGEAEERIGRWLRQSKATPGPMIVSKFPALTDSDPATQIGLSLEKSCAALGLDRIDLYLAHRGRDLPRPGVLATLERSVVDGRIGAFGASVYDAAEAAAVLAIPGVAAIQLPLNLVSVQAAQLRVLERATSRGIAIFARSVFLQGLLLIDAGTLDPLFARAVPVLERLTALARDAGTSRESLALAAVRSLPGVTSVVIGVDSAEQLAANLAAIEHRPGTGLVEAALAIGRDFPPELADPRRWRL